MDKKKYWIEKYRKNKDKILARQRKIRKAKEFITKECKRMPPKELMERVGYYEDT